MENSFLKEGTNQKVYTPRRSFKDQRLTNFPPAKLLTSYASLTFENNPIDSLETLPSLPDLKFLNINGTNIETFEGVKIQPKIEKLSLKNTPISHCHDVRIMAIIAFGPTLRIINNSPLTTFEIKIGKFLHNQIFQYLAEGWIIMSLYPLKIMNAKTHIRKIIPINVPKTKVTKDKGSCYDSESFSVISSPKSLSNELSFTSSFTKHSSSPAPDYLRPARRRCTLKGETIEPLPSYLPKKMHNLSAMTPEELRSAVKKALNIQKDKNDRSPLIENESLKRRKTGKLRKRNKDPAFFNEPDYQRASLSSSDCDEIAPSFEFTDNSPKSVKNPRNNANMGVFMEQLKNLKPMRRPEIMRGMIPEFSSTASISSSSGFDIISDAVLDRQRDEVASRASDFDITGSDAVSLSSVSTEKLHFQDSVDDMLPSKQRRRARMKKSIVRSRSGTVWEGRPSLGNRRKGRTSESSSALED